MRLPGGVDLVGVDEVENHPEGVGRVNVGINRSFIKRNWMKLGVGSWIFKNNSTVHTVLYYLELYLIIFYCMYFLYCTVTFFFVFILLLFTSSVLVYFFFFRTVLLFILWCTVLFFYSVVFCTFFCTVLYRFYTVLYWFFTLCTVNIKSTETIHPKHYRVLTN